MKFVLLTLYCAVASDIAIDKQSVFNTYNKSYIHILIENWNSSEPTTTSIVIKYYKEEYYCDHDILSPPPLFQVINLEINL